jgi:hypothetical protein
MKQATTAASMNFGHFPHGISLTDSVASGYAAAQRIDRFLLTTSIDSAASDLKVLTQEAA